MKTCDAVRERLVDLHYGLLAREDPEAERECRRHLADCASCAGELRKMEMLLGALRVEEAFPREREVNWDRFARETVALAVSGGGRRAWLRPAGLRPAWLRPAWLRPASLAWAAAASLVVAVALGVLLTRGPSQPAVEASVMMPESNIDNLTVNLARQNTAEYLKETRAVLVTLLDVNIHCDEGRVDVSAERAKATQLLRRQRLIAAELNRLPLARAQNVCDDLERLLVEISTLADCTRDADIQTLRDVVEKRQILVRMELLGQELVRKEAANV